MPIIYTITLLFITFLMIYLYFKYSCKKELKAFIDSFLDSQQSIMAVYDAKGLRLINRAGLELFGYSSLSTLRESHSDIVDFFIEEEGCLSKYIYGKRWIESIYNDKKNRNNTVKVKIFSKRDELEYYFYLKISKMHDSKEYLLTFNDITKLEKDKNKIQKLAELDPLTQIYNRVKLNEIFRTLFFNAKKYNSVVTMILFDIDHFKQINDNYGHNVGDNVLKELASLVRGLLRKEDIFARWGGEEFVIVLEGAALQETKKLASRLREEIEKFPFDIVEHITCSFGVTQFTQSDTESLFFERSDDALYEAKESGRNRVVVKEAK